MEIYFRFPELGVSLIQVGIGFNDVEDVLNVVLYTGRVGLPGVLLAVGIPGVVGIPEVVGRPGVVIRPGVILAVVIETTTVVLTLSEVLVVSCGVDVLSLVVVVVSSGVIVECS